ncbi:MAG: RdgB/HAM1 family non-canonical purine NTP pyrophosphatase [Ignavibacteriaceae bacterium]|nr:RdgB/HAM1 family non-canonical purine NTP pyrophosphatase [Ignavibacteriaceae bacterium]
MNKIIFATKNRGKIREVNDILKSSNIELVSLLDLGNVPEIVEDGLTFEDNAKIKAEIIFKTYGIPAMGDDSGLVVEQLDGRPGVYSARYAGEDATDDENNKKLLLELNNYSEPHHARFVCSAVYYDGNRFLTAYGEVKGIIIKEQRGDNGFGYDPLFLPDGYTLTSGELSLEEKNKISHRAIAFRNLKKLIV